MYRSKSRQWVAACLTLLMVFSLLGVFPAKARADSPSVLLNSGFEQVGSNGKPVSWTDWNATGISSSTTTVHSGVYSVQLFDPDSTTTSVDLRSVRIPVTVGKEYEASIYSYNNPGKTGGTYLYLEFFNASNVSLVAPRDTNSTVSQWKFLYVSQVAPATAAYAVLRLYSGKADAGTSYFDDATVGEVIPPKNSGFEQITNGRPVGWGDWSGAWTTIAPSTTTVHSGVYSVQLTDPDTTISVDLRSQVIPITGGKEYEASIYSYNTPGTQGSSHLYFDFLNAAGASITSVTPRDTNSTTGQWKQLFVSQVAPADAVSVRLRLYSGKADVGTSYFDDVTFNEVISNPYILLKNGDMELLANGMPRFWTSLYGGDIAASQVRKRSGDNSLRITDADASNGFGVRSQLIPVTPGVNYQAEAFAYNESGSPTVFLEFWNDASTNTANNLSNVLASSSTLNAWKPIRASGVAPAGAKYASVRLWSGAANVGTTYFDDVSFSETPPDASANLNNGAFEKLDNTRPSQWRAIDGTVEIANAPVSEGTHSVKVTNTAGQKSALRSHLISVSPGMTYTSGVSAFASAGTAKLELEFWDADKVFLSSQSQMGVTGNVWEPITLTSVTPGQAAYASLRLGTSETTGGTVYFDSATFIRSGTVSNSKTRTTLYSPEKVAAARQNVAQLQWAKSMKDAAVSKADTYLAKGLDFLWYAIPGQTLPRSYAVNQALGSPVTGKAVEQFGNYPYQANPLNEPWKIVDPSSGYKFPTNDFGAFYNSGLDEHGMFRPELADRSLLVNTLYPEKGPTWGVDDGLGWVDDQGNRYTFIAYYVHWFVWYRENSLITQALVAFRDAYLYTGDVKYARAGTIMLDRVADMYPEMDVSKYDRAAFINSWGKSVGQGKVVGGIWETENIKTYLSAYDAFFPAMDDPATIQFLQQKAVDKRNTNAKNSGSAIRRNIEDGIVKQVFPAVKKTQILGNDGMHQSALAMAAVVYDTLPDTKEWLDFIFQTGEVLFNPTRLTGGNILNSLVANVDRDGNGNESSPGYNLLWLQTHRMTADILEGYDLYPGADLYQNVKFQKMFSAMNPLLLSEKYTANIGDTGRTGNPFLVYRMSDLVKAFDKYGDPIYAQLIYFMNNNTTDGIHTDVFAANPNAIADRIQAAIGQYGLLDLKSINESGYGFTALRDGESPDVTYGTRLGFGGMTVSAQSKPLKFVEESGSVLMEAAQNGEMATFEFDVPETDDYDLDVLAIKGPASGIYRISIDGQFVKDLDFYGEDSSSYMTLKRMNLTQGTHQIAFVGNGKNASSSGYTMGIRVLNLLNEDARVLRDAQTDAKNTLRDVWMFYGRDSTHGHRDTLNIGMHAFGLDLSPDLGYPEYADNVDMHRAQWVVNTISHNTVNVDARKQNENVAAADPKHFNSTDLVKLIDVESPDVYPQTSLYKRTTAMIKADEENSYTVDLFRVKGGSDHYFSFHGADGAVTTEGLNFTAQPTGTYAGPNVAYAQRYDDIDGPLYMGSGFHYLKNVERDASPSEQFSIDWNVKDTWNVYGQGSGSPTDVHLRLTMLGHVNDVALADGVPPTNKVGNPATLRYMIAHRNGTNLDSLFTSIIEPYKGERFITSITPLVVKAGDQAALDSEVRAVRVTLQNGRTDYIISSLDATKAYSVELPDADYTLAFKGFLGVYSVQDDGKVNTYLHDGSYIRKGDEEGQAHVGAITGTVTSFTQTLSQHNEIVVEVAGSSVLPADLVGKSVIIQNDGVGNAAYTVQGVTVVDDTHMKLDIGDITLVRSYKDPNDFSKGFIYNIAAGASFRIPLTYTSSQTPSVDPPVDGGSGGNPGATPDDAPGGTSGVVSGGISSGGQTPAGQSIQIHPNGAQITNIIAELEKTPDGRTIASRVIEEAAFLKAADALQDGKQTIVVEVQEMEAGVKIQLPASAVSAAQSKAPHAWLRLQQDILTVNLPLASVDINELSKKLGAKAEDIKLSLSVSPVASTTADAMHDYAKQAGVKPVADPIEITLHAEAGGRQTSIGDFNGAYATGTFNVTGATDTKKLTAVSVDPLTGQLRFLPAIITVIGNTAQVTVKMKTAGIITVVESSKSFEDMSNHWAKSAVELLASKLVIQGTTANEFAPQAQIPRAQFAVLLARALSLPQGEAGNYADIQSSDWFADEVAAATQAGIIDGFDNGTFQPDANMTREQAAVMITRVLKLLDKEPTEASKGLSAFTDSGQISSYAKDAVADALHAGIINGVTDSAFVPRANATRAEAAVMLIRLMQYVEFINN